MVNLEFKKIKCSAIITCISEDGTINDLDAIKSDIQNGFTSIVDDIVLERNNVVAFEISEVDELSDGDCDE